MTLEPWFQRLSLRLEDELQALEKAGYIYRIDAAARAAGQIVISVDYPLGDEVHELRAHFPDSYPYFPFDIASETFPEGRHKGPSGELCFMRDPSQNWSAQNDRLAAIIQTQVGKIAAAHADPSKAGEIEAHEASQITGHFSYMPGSTVITGDTAAIPGDRTYGYLVLGVDGADGSSGQFRGAVLEVQDESGAKLAELDQRLSKRYEKTIKGRWIRLQSAPSIDIRAALAEAIKAWPNLKEPRFRGGPDVVGFLIPEEVEYGQYHENWIFVVRQKVAEERNSKGKKRIAYFARSDRVTHANVMARVPPLSALATKKVLVVGLGSVGSMFAWQMARAGIGTLHLVDFDHLQGGNSPRWLLGWRASGHEKSQLLSSYLRDQYPFTEVRSWTHRIGSGRHAFPQTDNEVLEEALAGVDLIFDATAEWCVSHFLSDLAKARGISYVWATGTPGAQGGVVGRVMPGKTGGCWKCFQRRMADGDIDVPSQAHTPEVQPAGCFHATFTGTGFDMDHVTLGAVRLSVGTLCSGEKHGYPEFDWDVGVINTWSKDAPIAPEWKTYKLEAHSGCNCDAARKQ